MVLALEGKNIGILASPTRRGTALLSSAITRTRFLKVYTEPYVFVGKSSAKRYVSVKAELFSREVREIIERLQDITIDLRVAVFDASKNNGSSYTLEIVIHYNVNIVGALCLT